MKKINFLFFFLLVILQCSFADAASVMRDALNGGRFNFGAELTCSNERRMSDKDLARISSNQYLITGDYSLADRLKIFAKCGLADLELHYQEGETTLFSEGTAIGAGIRGIVFEDIVKSRRLAVEIQYFQYKPKAGGETTGVR